MSSNGESRISVSEEKLELALAKFKNELVKEFQRFATTKALEEVAAQVKVLQLWQANVIGAGQNQRRVSDRALAYAGLLVGLATALATIIWLQH